MWNLLILFLYLVVIITVWLNYRNSSFKWNSENLKIDQFSFPKHFLWGVATSAYQVEGSCDNTDWAIWEKSFDEEGLPRIRNKQKAGMATDHWNKFREDIRLIKDLGCNTYRFSVEWSKIEPLPGKWEPAALEHYQEVCEALRQEHIIPFVTLHHFTNPIWLYERGGFENVDAIRYFADYAAKVGESLAPWVDFWATFNEPVVFAMLGWLRGSFPPGKKDAELCGRVLFNVLKAHAEAYYALHDIDRTDADGDGIPCNVGLVKSITIFDPFRKWYLSDWISAWLKNKEFNCSVIDALMTGKYVFRTSRGIAYKNNCPRLVNSIDWIGVNYYFQELCKFGWSGGLKVNTFADPKLEKTDMGWAIYPAGLYRAIQMVSPLGIPVYITENGLASDDDDKRKKYILEHLDAVNEAIVDGYDVRGYMHWSLMDNFEWAEGFEKHFGLYHVDFDTQERVLKQGSKIYQDIIATFKK